MTHSNAHPLQGQVVPLLINGSIVIEFEVEDWADRVRTDGPADQVYGRVLTIQGQEQEIPLSRTFTDDALHVKGHS